MRDATTADDSRTIVTEDAHDLAEQASALLLAVIGDSLAERGRARVILAGGETPRETYSLLAEGLLVGNTPVERLSWYLGDERWVLRDHQRSNERMARDTLLGRIAAAEDSIHSWDAGWGNPVECARLYGEAVGRVMGRPEEAPDLLILGLGVDGHTASLFPGAIAHMPGGVHAPVGPDLPGNAAAVQGDADRGWRLTLCPVFLRTSRCVVFIVAGADKAPALRRARAGDPSTPAAWIKGGTTWFVATREAMGPEKPEFGRNVLHA
jgi:6-phosphogluconolactonase